MTEIWRDIKEYEGLYQVSNLGRVRNSRTGRILKQHSNDKGYLYVPLTKNGKLKFFRVHRLVGMAFPDLVDWTEEAKGKPFNEITVNHKDEHKDNNCVGNLEWCTMGYQIKYKDRLKRVSEKLLNRKDHSKPVLQYTLDGQFVAEYPSIAEASRETGFSKGYICSCLKGNYKSTGNYKWVYTS